MNRRPTQRRVPARQRAAVLAALVLATCTAHAAPAGDPCPQLPPIPAVIALDEGSRATQAFDAQRELRTFALHSYRRIADDLVDGRGPYLDALSNPFLAHCPDRAALLAWLRNLLASSASAPEFSRRAALALAVLRASQETAAVPSEHGFVSRPLPRYGPRP